MSTTEQRLTRALDTVAREHGIPSLVLADEGGLLIAAASEAADTEAVAAYAACKVAGVTPTPEMSKKRVKAREVPVRGGTLVLGATGDTAICAPALDRAARDVQSALDR